MKLLAIKNWQVQVEEKEVVRGVNLTVNKGEVVAVMGPNGSGKSSLAKSVMGSEEYEVKKGELEWYGGGKKESLLDLAMFERARKGLFLAWQNPPEIEGVKIFSLVKESWRARGMEEGSLVKLKERLQKTLVEVGLKKEFWEREVNVGMSGGEKKRLELALMMMLQPKMVILDEIDSGLDVDSLRMAGRVVKRLRKQGTGFMVITHYGRFLEYVEVDKVVIMKAGRVVKRGGRELVEMVERQGFGGK